MTPVPAGAPRASPRAEVVGSLLRPARLREAYERVYEHGRLKAASLVGADRRAELDALAEVQDELVAAAVARQVELGLDVVSDGEYRRAHFTSSFYDAIAGVERGSRPLVFRDEHGHTLESPGPPIVAERLRKVGNPAAREARYLSSLTDHPFKVTFPAGSFFAWPHLFQPGITDAAYADHDEMVDHALAIERELVGEAIAAGARYVQFDFPVYPFLVDERWLAMMREDGFDPQRVLDKAISADRAVLEGIPADVRTALHICRGNYRGHWLAEGSLEPVAERVFAELPYDSFLVEWDDVRREGGYEPIRFVPEGRVVGLGIVSTKRPEVETPDVLLRHVEEATRYAPVERLAISPQCGFASTWEGNPITEDIQWRKLDVVARVADRIWGRSA